MIPLLAVSLVAIVVLAVLLWRKERQLESVIAASELARKEQAEAATKERDKLLQRIQAPEIATIPEIETAPAYVPADDFAGLNDQRERLEAMNDHRG